MAKIILDISANTHKNNWDYLKKMLNELQKVDTGKHEIIIKHQLFKEAGQNIPLEHELFYYAYDYAKELGYKTTSSVFDKKSLDFLLKFDVPFVKIANNRKLDWLIGEIPRKIPVYVSCGNYKEYDNANNGFNLIRMACISKYPASIKDYENNFIYGSDYEGEYIQYGIISDHTINFDLWHKYKPRIIEWHYGLEDSTGLDAGPFMRTPTMLAEVL